MKHNNNGFTLIELVLVLALLFIVIVPAYQIIKNVFVYEDKTSNLILLNQEIQIIENMVDTYLKESDNVISIYDQDNVTNKVLETTEVNLDSMILTGRYGSESKIRLSLLEGSLVIDFVKLDGDNIDIINTVKSGDNIDKIIVTPVRVDDSFKNAVGLQLTFYLSKDGYEKKEINRYYFRNK